jgi:hypothetical protein
MLLPVAAAFGARPAVIPALSVAIAIPPRTIEFRAIFTRTFELWTILARPRETRTFVATAISRVALAIPVARLVVTGLVEFRPVEFALTIAARRTLKTFLAFLPGLRFPARRTIAKILARATIPAVAAISTATGEFAFAAKLPLGPIAVARRSRAIGAIAARPVAILAKTFAARRVRALVAITPPRSVRLLVAELPVGKTRRRASLVAIGARGVGTLVATAVFALLERALFAAITGVAIAITRVALAITRVALAIPVTVEFRPVAARLERALLAVAVTRGTIAERPIAAGTVIAAEPRLVATAIAIELLVEFFGPKGAFGEFLLRPPRLAGTALATVWTVTPAARGVIVFVGVARHERARFYRSNGNGRAANGAYLTQTQVGLLLKDLPVADLFRQYEA